MLRFVRGGFLVMPRHPVPDEHRPEIATSNLNSGDGPAVAPDVLDFDANSFLSDVRRAALVAFVPYACDNSGASVP